MTNLLLRRALAQSLVLSVSLAGCGNKGPSDSSDDSHGSDTATSSHTQTEDSSSQTDHATDSQDETTDASDSDTQITGTAGEGISCQYLNPFSKAPECREYLGEWTPEQIAADCADILEQSGTVVETACTPTGSVGTCYAEVGEGRSWNTTYYNLDEQSLGVAATMCSSYWKGTWHDPGDTDTGGPVDALLSEAKAAMISDSSVAVSPECADTDCLEQLSDEGRGIEFSPTTGTPAAGLVVLPEQNVDPRAYAPAAKLLAMQGFFVAVLTSALASAHAQNEIESHSSIATWLIGGHGQGGTAAAALVHSTPAAVDGLFLWGGLVGEEASLASSSLPVSSSFGMLDGVVTPQDVTDDAAHLPPHPVMVALRGANHEQFSYFRECPGDNEATIERIAQHDMFVGATSHFIRGVLSGPQELHLGFPSAALADAVLCRETQLLIANPAQGLEAADINVTAHESAISIRASRPDIDTDQTAAVEIHSYDHLGGNPTLRSGPPVHAVELWCKMKSQDALALELGMSAAGPSGTCATANEAALEEALDLVSEQERSDFLAFGPTVTFEPDVESATGLEWLSETSVSIVPIPPSSFSVTSPRLEVPLDSGLEEFRGNCYCKVWSVSRALRFVLDGQ
ncbi:MAG: alpha/beta hydrolase [Myxococcota bacterium]|jgi:predicted small lipoprotein YifL|nr:alpha/beta hydrolase [Myxococcota bacterium]